jgi:speckle-type POZ protein
VTGQHLLHIDGYSRTKEDLPTGKSIKSRPFRAGDGNWFLLYYPNGISSDCAEFMSIALKLDASVAAVFKAQAKISLLDPAGNLVPGYTKTLPAREYSSGGHGCGIGNFVKRDWLEKSEYLLDDCVKISCAVTIYQKLRTEDTIAPSPSPSPPVVVPPSDLNQHLGNLFRTKDGADVTFQVAGETIRAHRFLLAARSLVFKAELSGGMKESTAPGDCIRIDDMLPEVFNNLLHFAYTDLLPEMEEKEEAVMSQHLLEAADRYDMQRLKLICEDKLCRHLDASTAATTLVLAEQHNCQGLKEACIEFLKSPEALQTVMETDGFEHLTKSCPALVKELLSRLSTCSCKRRKLSQ